LGANENQLRRVLNADEMIRAERFKDPILGQQWAYFRFALRQILSRYLFYKPHQIQFKFGSYGKPELISPRSTMYFSLSHASAQARLAITRIAPIGVDTEFLKPIVDMRDIAQRFYCIAEYERWMAYPESDKINRFYQLWTLKEAVIKAQGSGLSLPLDCFAVNLDDTDAWHAIEQYPPLHKNTTYLTKFVGIAQDYATSLALQISPPQSPLHAQFLNQTPSLLNFDYCVDNNDANPLAHPTAQS
jgi:phosphopantetheine--protein transferase-like protein